jgi:hypothetical protein
VFVLLLEFTNNSTVIDKTNQKKWAFYPHAQVYIFIERQESSTFQALPKYPELHRQDTKPLESE